MNAGGLTGDNVGTVQGDAMQGHRHTITLGSGAVVTANNVAPIQNAVPSTGTATINDPVNDGTNGVPRTSSETRPINANVNYFIKFTRTASPVLAQSEVVAATVYYDGLAYGAIVTANLTGGVKILDTHNFFNASTGVVTIPTAGFYEFSGYLQSNAGNTHNVGAVLRMYINGTYVIASGTADAAGVYSLTAASTPIILYCTAGQVFNVQLNKVGDFGGSLIVGSQFSRVTIKKVG
jgi:hypothetical protein